MKTEIATPLKSSRIQLLVIGGPQAEGAASILRAMPSFKEAVDVSYSPSSGAKALELIKAGAMVCAQAGTLQPSIAAIRASQIITFPELSFSALWPFNCVNPYNPVEMPRYPYGRFPYGDSFIANSVQRGTPSKEIIEFCFSQAWPSSWPDLDELFELECKRLTSLDSQNDIKIGHYIIRSFASRRLFANINSPSNVLLAALSARIARRLLPKVGEEQLVLEADGAIGGAETPDVLGIIEVPVHPAVAKHFGLVWYSKESRYNYFGEGQLTYTEYYQRLVEQSYKIKLNPHPAGNARTRTTNSA